MPYGHITRLEPEHGFGFLVDDSGLDWFFVQDGLRTRDFRRVWVGERVGFIPESTPKGPRATDIHFEQLD
ncbi:MAG: cold shock domain-containing protein [Acidobacteriota bacterium]